MKKLLIALTLLFFIQSCINNYNKAASLVELIPNNSSVVIKINDLETFNTDVKNNDLVSSIFSNTKLNNKLSYLDQVNTINTIFICIDKNTEDFTVLTKFEDSLIRNPDSLNLNFKIIDSVFIGSSSKTILNSIKRTPNLDFETINNTTNELKSFTLFLKNDDTKLFSSFLIDNDNLPFSNWISLDLDISPDRIKIDGIGIHNDTLTKSSQLFNNSIPQENTLKRIMPENVLIGKVFTYNDFQNLRQNLNEINPIASDSIYNYELIETFNEIGEIVFNKDTLLVARSIDATATNEALRSHQNEIGLYRNVVIKMFEDVNLFSTQLYPLISSNSVSNYIQLEEFFVFAESVEALHSIISNFQNNTTLANNHNFVENEISLSDESSFLIYSTQDGLRQLISSFFNDYIEKSEIEQYSSSSIQLIKDDGFIHINGIVNKGKKKAQFNTISEEFSVTLESDIILTPQFVQNHRTKQKEIVVQDVNNNLYLISNRGKVLWKKQLNGNILGKIVQVDLYKNGRLQLAFATPKRVYVIDRNGNDVSPFPLNFRDEITQPLSVFDYDNTKNYRFLVTQGSELLMYDRKGKTVRGFLYNASKNNILTQPKHFRLSNKDYIVFAAGNSMQILNRRGQTRINVKESISFSLNEIYNYKNRFTTTSSNGELVQVNLNGSVSKQTLNLDRNHHIDATSKTLVTSFENTLNIKQKTYELDFGNYTSPKIFYLNDKIYVSITDLQSKKVFLFDSQARVLNNFPVYGNSKIDLANIDRDQNLEFVTIGDNNSIIVYQKN